jgi:hypothetical protein
VLFVFYYENEKLFLAPIAVKILLSWQMILDSKIILDKSLQRIAGGKFLAIQERCAPKLTLSNTLLLLF